MEHFALCPDFPEPPAGDVVPVDDTLTANDALRRLERGRTLLYQGDFHNAKQLLGALTRRITRRAKGRSPTTPAQAFALERQTRARAHALLSRLVVALDSSYTLRLRRAPATAQACRWAWGEPPPQSTLVPLAMLLGVLGSAEWRRTGLAVPGLSTKLEPHYGVYLPTRTDYLKLLHHLPTVQGKTVIEVGTGTGVLSLLLLEQGASSVVASDIDERAVVCATANAARLGFADKFRAVHVDGFPAASADIAICNPPWLPIEPKTALDRAVYDSGHALTLRYLEGLKNHLKPGGTGLLMMSNLAELLGLRESSWLESQFNSLGLSAVWQRSASPSHPRAHDRTDPLHLARSQERVTLYALQLTGN